MIVKMSSTAPALLARRLRAQRLVGTGFRSPVDVVRWFGAVQAQDYGAAKWALALRSRAATDAAIDELVDTGAILRTHVMRPTWHFVVPEDVGWLVELTGARLRAGLAGRYRQLEIDERQMRRAFDAFARALSERGPLTRPELARVLEAARIPPAGQRLPHFLLAAETYGLLVSGPRRGREHTYALRTVRAPQTHALDRDAALAELAHRYFRGHGPATARDFVWWSGLTLSDARVAIALAGDRLKRYARDGVERWAASDASPAPIPTGTAHLLPNFDEYTVGYADRSALADPRHPFDASLFSFGSVLANVVIVDGRVRAAWSRTLARSGVDLEVRPLGSLTRGESVAVARAAQRLGRFLGRTVRVHVGPIGRS
jgi:hypothetical protein